MNVLIDYRHREEDLKDLPIADLAAFVMRSEGRGDSAEVSISFVNNDVIAELNQRYRGIEGPTDVLSFECDGVADEVSPEDAEEDIFELGDVIIAPDVARTQSYEYGTSFEEEVSLLLVHGLLHLFGYDHIEDDDAEIMEAREAALLDAWANR